MNGPVVTRAGDVQQEQIRFDVADGAVVFDDRAVHGDRRKAAGEKHAEG